jgi:hypothetical protein
MDLLYSDISFRQYFNFVDKYRAFESVDTMQENNGLNNAQKLLQLFDSLKTNSNEIQMSCCMNELADTLNEVSQEEIHLLESGDSYAIVLEIMDKNFMNHDIQYCGVFALSRLMEESEEIKRKFISLEVQDFIVKLMKHYKNDMVIQAVCCRMFVMLVEDAEVKQYIHFKSAIEVVAHAMKNFEEEEELLPALQALTKLMQTDQDENCEQNFVHQQFHVLVLDILENHIESGNICHLLHN